MKKLFRFLVAGLLATLMVNACNQIVPLSNGEAQKANITISGAFALYPLMMRWAEEFQKNNPDVHFDIDSGGAGKGMEDILAKKVDIGMLSREITATEEDQGAYPVMVAKDAVFPMINSQNPVVEALLTHGISHETLVKIFISGEVKTWGQAIGNLAIPNKIHIYTRTEPCGAAEIWSLYLGGVQSDLLGDGKFGDYGVIRALASDPQGIGYSNQIYAYGLGDVPPEGTLILPIDLNGNNQADPEEILDTRQKATAAVAAGLYPAPPSRFLYLVTNGKPEGVVQVFLEWVLSEGQVYIDTLGYVQLSDEQLNIEFEKIR